MTRPDDVGTGGGRVDYQALAGIYARYRAASPRILGKLVEYAGRYQAPRVLEVGCGTADFSAALREVVEPAGGDVSGFDKSEVMLEQARAKHPGLRLGCGDAEAEAWPCPEGTVDLVFSVDVIHYIRDLDRYFGEARRVLRPGGMIVTVTDSEDDIAGRTMTRYFPETVPHELTRYHSAGSLDAAMRRAGFAPSGADHTRHDMQMEQHHLDRFRQRIFSALRIISDEEFERGLARLEAEWAAGGRELVELYTYCWGIAAGVEAQEG